MKVDIGTIEVSDEQRNALARLLAGKDTKKLATRDQFRAYVDGCISSLAGAQGSPNIPPEGPVLSTVSDRASVSEVTEQLQREGKTEDYIQSYLRGRFRTQARRGT